MEEEEKEAGDATDVDAQRKTRSAVVRTSTRQTIFLPVPGLVDPQELKPSDLVGTNKDSYLILEKLPAEFDSRVQAMEVDERPTEEYSDIGGADQQIQELIEAVVLPMTHKDMFDAIGIRPPKGVLLHGPPGTGKTLLARACANQTNAIFLKLAGPQLVQMFIGDGAKLIRDAFELAKAKIQQGVSAGAILFIDEIDAIGTKRFGGDQSGDREVQRTMLELLSQLDGFSSNEMIKVIAATNRPDVLDPTLGKVIQTSLLFRGNNGNSFNKVLMHNFRRFSSKCQHSSFNTDRFELCTIEVFTASCQFLVDDFRVDAHLSRMNF